MTPSVKPLLSRSEMSAVAWLLLVVAAVSAVLAVAIPLQQLTEPGAGVPVTLSDEAADRPGPDLPGLPTGVQVGTAAEEYELTADRLPAGLRLLSQASATLVFLAVAGGAWCLAMVLRSIQAGRPFDRRNPGRLAGLALAVVVGGLVAPVVGDVAANAVLDHLGLLGPASPFVMVLLDLEFNPLLGAAVVLAFAEAFRRGGALDDDVRGLV